MLLAISIGPKTRSIALRIDTMQIAFEDLEHRAYVDKLHERAIEAHLDKSVLAIQTIAEMQIPADVPERATAVQRPNHFRKATQVISAMTIHTGDHHHVYKRRDLKE